MTFKKLLLLLAGSVGARILGAGLGLVTQILIARLFVQADVGVVFLAMSYAAIFALIVSAGYPTLGLTEFPRLLFLGRDRVLRAFHGAYLREWFTINCAVLVLVLLAIALLPLDRGNKVALFFGVLSSPVSAMIRYSSAVANSMRLFAVAFVPDNVVRPGLLLLFVAGCYLLGLPLTVTSILIAFVASNAVAALVQLPFVQGKGLQLSDWRAVRPTLSRVVRVRSYSLAIVAGVSTLFADIVTLLGGFLMTKEDVAVLGVTIRLAAIAGFVIQASQQYALPDLTSALASRDEAASSEQIYRLNLMTAALILAALLGSIVLGGFALSIFGTSYAEGHILLVMFMLGQAIRAMGGMNQVLLSVGGKQLTTLWACLAAVGVLSAAWIMLAPALGLLGVGIAVIAAELVWAVLLAVHAKAHTGRRADLLWAITRK